MARTNRPTDQQTTAARSTSVHARPELAGLDCCIGDTGTTDGLDRLRASLLPTCRSRVVGGSCNDREERESTFPCQSFLFLLWHHCKQADNNDSIFEVHSLPCFSLSVCILRLSLFFFLLLFVFSFHSAKLPVQPSTGSFSLLTRSFILSVPPSRNPLPPSSLSKPTSLRLSLLPQPPSSTSSYPYPSTPPWSTLFFHPHSSDSLFGQINSLQTKSIRSQGNTPQHACLPPLEANSSSSNRSSDLGPDPSLYDPTY